MLCDILHDIFLMYKIYWLILAIGRQRIVVLNSFDVSINEFKVQFQKASPKMIFQT